MNILVLSWRDPKHPLAGGAEQVMHEHMKGWIRAGHKVTLFSSKMKNLRKSETTDGIRVTRRGYQYLGVQLAAFYWYVFGKHETFDLVVDQFHGLPFFTPVYIWKPKKIAVIQETTREVWLLNPLPFPLNILIGVLGYLFEFLVFIPYKNTQFMTGSVSTVEAVVKMGIPRKNIKIVPHGTKLYLPKRKVKKNKFPVVLFLGRISKDKGIEEAVKVFSILSTKGEFKFWVFGKPETREYGEEIFKQVKDLGLENKIKFWCYNKRNWIFVDDREKFKIIAGADLTLNPSYREGWGLVNIEANAVGVPVVAYRSPGLVDSVKNGVSGIICKHNTPSEMAREVVRIIRDRGKYIKLKKGAIKWSKNFTWDKSIKSGLDLINDII